MAYDIFIDIDGIPGESLDAKYKDKIAVLSYSFGVSQSGTFAYNSGGGAGKSDFTSFTFRKHTDSATHLLFQHCAIGQHIPKVQLIVRKAGGEQREFFKVNFTDVIVQSFNTIGDTTSSDSQPLEEITLGFSTIKVSYAKQKQDGSMEAFKDAGWSLKENQKL
jgi:type VI secretion system secreted protein Hcp